LPRLVNLVGQMAEIPITRIKRSTALWFIRMPSRFNWAVIFGEP